MHSKGGCLIARTRGDVFVEHIERHLTELAQSREAYVRRCGELGIEPDPPHPEKVICNICGKDVDTIFEEEGRP